jgi:hypothetical protein
MTPDINGITRDILAALRTSRAGLWPIIKPPMLDYHGHGKARMHGFFLRPILRPYQASETSVQIEIVSVDTDLRHEVHKHHIAHAIVTALGEPEGFPDAVLAHSYAAGVWHEIYTGDQIDIPPGTPHGFTTSPGGVLWFLSVQSPPIVGHDGNDDYHPHQPNKRQMTC